MATKKYKTFLSKSPQDIEKQELEFKVQEGELQLKADILATKKSLQEAKRELESVKGKFPFDAQAILEAEDKVTDIEVTITRLKKLEIEMF